MKRLVIVCSLSITSILLLASLSSSQNESTQNDISQKESTQMNRTRTHSGLEYIILKQGSGESPKTGNIVTVHYTGWLDVNGHEGAKFDSSVDRGTPFEFQINVGKVIQGWDEGVMTMKIGEKRRLYIPSALGYGAYGAGRGLIPANANLIFDVELISIK
jgi:FKBP-type peptidyl-prolyl cis-trans isomerase FkpA